MLFALMALGSAFIGRVIGWRLSPLLYRCKLNLCVLLCVAGSVGIAFGVRLLVDWLHPGLLLKALGFLGGAYISQPAFGAVHHGVVLASPLLDWTGDPYSFANRTLLIQIFPLACFILASIVLALRA